MENCNHEWKYYNEEFAIQLNFPISINIPTKTVSTTTEFFRICHKCMLKQKQSPWSSEEFQWKDTNAYNKEEKRELKLREILKGKDIK